MATICGGKLTTYRLMAERVSDNVCARLGVHAPCRTANEALVPDPDKAVLRRAARYFPMRGLTLMADRLGDDLPAVLQQAELAGLAEKQAEQEHAGGGDGNPLLCECEMVSLAEIECVARDPSTHSLSDIRLRNGGNTRVKTLSR